MKKQLCRGKIKDGLGAERGRPRKTSCTHSNRNFTAFPRASEKERGKMAAWSLSHLCRFVILFLFVLVSLLLLPVLSKSYSLPFLSLCLLLCCPFSPPSAFFLSHRRAHARMHKHTHTHSLHQASQKHAGVKVV